MPRGISLHVGINKVSSAFPSASELKGAENDALAMEAIAIENKFNPHDVLLGSEATYGRVSTKIRAAAAELNKGDFFLFTFAGHGFQRVDIAPGDEPDFRDETILLFDFELYDDVLREVFWPLFRKGVRILIVADSCHSGSVATAPGDALVNSESVTKANVRESIEIPVRTPDGLLARTISPVTGERHLAEYGLFYQLPTVPLLNPPINASVLLLAACEDDQTTGDLLPHGVFTAALLKVLKDQKPVDYPDLHKKLGKELASRPQDPVLKPIEPADEEFMAQKPFTI